MVEAGGSEGGRIVQLRARPRNDFPGRHTQAPGPGLPLTVAPLHYAVLPTPTLLPLPRLGSPKAKPAPPCVSTEAYT